MVHSFFSLTKNGCYVLETSCSFISFCFFFSHKASLLPPLVDLDTPAFLLRCLAVVAVVVMAAVAAAVISRDGHASALHLEGKKNHIAFYKEHS